MGGSSGARLGSLKAARERGFIGSEDKNYEVRGGDAIYWWFNVYGLMVLGASAT